MKPIALSLLLTLPVLSWAQATNPAYPQPNPSSDAPVAASLVPRDSASPLVEPAPVPTYQHWYFWAAIGTVVTGIVATSAYVVLSSRTVRTATPVCGGCESCVASCR